MKPIKPITHCIVWAFCLLATAGWISAAPFQNGSFETPVTPGRSLPIGDTTMPGWMTGGQGTLRQNPVPQPDFPLSAVDGSQVIQFNAAGQAPGATLSQTFDTTPGNDYLVTFFLGRAGLGSGTQRMRTEVRSALGDLLASFVTTAPTNESWGSPRTLAFVAVTTNSTLTFADISSATTNVDMLLDNVTVAPQPQAGILAGPITNAANGHTYYLLTQNHWVESERKAMSMGGHLATIDDAAENLWVYSTFSSYGGEFRGLWIGLNAREDPGSFRWASGAPVTYTKWSPTEPNGPYSTEIAVHMYAPNHTGSESFWNDIGDLATAFGGGAQFATLHGVVEIDPLKISIQVSHVAIAWNSSLDIKYQPQYVSVLTSNSWTNLGAPVLGTGSNSVVFDAVLGQPQKFYRVIAVP